MFEYRRFLEDDPRCVTFWAERKGSNGFLVVKFVDGYGVAVHRFLADRGHAAKLLYYGPLPAETIYNESPTAVVFKEPWSQRSASAGQRALEGQGAAVGPEMKIVVMEYVEGQGMDLSDKGAHNQISGILEELRNSGFVFGDLRMPNVLVDKSRKVKLVDFDWAGCYDVKGLPQEA
jgi:hypothetical protein